MHTIATNCPYWLVIHDRLQTTDCLTKRSCGSQTKPLPLAYGTILNSYVELLLNDGGRNKLSSDSGTPSDTQRVDPTLNDGGWNTSTPLQTNDYKRVVRTKESNYTELCRLLYEFATVPASVP